MLRYFGIQSKEKIVFTCVWEIETSCFVAAVCSGQQSIFIATKQIVANSWSISVRLSEMVCFFARFISV